MSNHFFTIKATFNLDGKKVASNIQVETENLELDKVAKNARYSLTTMQDARELAALSDILGATLLYQ